MYNDNKGILRKEVQQLILNMAQQMDFKNLVLTILNSAQRLTHTGRLAAIRTAMIILLKFGNDSAVK